MILYDFRCNVCDHTYENLVPAGTTEGMCPLCTGPSTRVLSAPHVGVMNDPARRAEALAKRSHEHSVREARKNPEKLARSYGATPRSQTPWNLRSQKSSS